MITKSELDKLVKKYENPDFIKDDPVPLTHNDKGGSIYRSNPFYTVKKWLTNWLTLTFFNTIFGAKIRY